MQNVGVLLLAAGTSSRLQGEVKQLLKVGNKSLLNIAIENAQKVTPENVFCVLGANAQKIKSQIPCTTCTIIFNANFDKGLSSSIVCGIQYIEKRNPTLNAVLLLLADQPEVDVTYLSALVEAHQKKPSKIIATSYLNSLGVPAIFPKKYFKELQLLKGDFGAKMFLKEHCLEVITIQRENSFIDIDTKEDYLNYINKLGGGDKAAF